MWGEFEDEEQDKRKECHPAQSSPERLCAASEIPGSTATKEDDMYALPLRDRLVHFLSTSNVEVKSQQKYEPDLTYEERKEIIEKLLNEKPGQFLYRFGKYLEREHLQYFLQYEGDVEVDHFLTETLKSKNKHTAKITVRNRRYAALQKMRKSGDYFSEEEMERRDPLLYDHLIGQHQTQEERDQKYSANSTEEKFSTLLLHHIDYRAHKELKKRQEDQEDDMLEEEDSDSDDDDDDDDGDAEMDSGIESREKQMFKEEFYSAGYNAFIRGENKDFDYKEVDDNDALDLLDIQARDEEERYFDEEEEGSHLDMDYNEKGS